MAVLENKRLVGEFCLFAFGGSLKEASHSEKYLSDKLRLQLKASISGTRAVSLLHCTPTLVSPEQKACCVHGHGHFLSQPLFYLLQRLDSFGVGLGLVYGELYGWFRVHLRFGGSVLWFGLGCGWFVFVLV